MSVDFREDFRNQRVYVRIQDLRKLTRRAIRQSFFVIGRDWRGSASKEILRKPKSGRTYIRRDKAGRRRKHVASAPGETHANMTGKLRRSLGWIVRGSQTLEVGYGVDKEAPNYGEYLEFGTRKIKPRPSIQNAIKDINRNVETYFNDEFTRQFK